jgi:tetratricopeptide (TPR) repeat protein
MSVAGLLSAFMLAALPPVSESPSAPDLFHQAEAAFQEAVQRRDNPPEARRLFRESAEHYEQLRRQGVCSAALYLNQGNAYLLAGDLPHAILAYRRGLQLDPNDRGLQYALAHARDQVIYPPSSALGRPAVEHWPPWLPRPTAGPLLALLAVLYGLGCLGLTRWWMTRNGKLLWLGGIVLTGALLPVGGLALLAYQDGQARRQPVVVIARDNVHLHRGNGSNYPLSQADPLNRGVEARQLHVRGDWLQVELAGGEVGWLPRSAVLVDGP